MTKPSDILSDPLLSQQPLLSNAEQMFPQNRLTHCKKPLNQLCQLCYWSVFLLAYIIIPQSRIGYQSLQLLLVWAVFNQMALTGAVQMVHSMANRNFKVMTCLDKIK